MSTNNKTNEQLDAAPPSDAQYCLPVLEETIHVDKQIVDSGRGLRVVKTVLETPQVIEQALSQDQFVVTHVLHDRLIEDNVIPMTRHEGTTMIIPIIEEVLVWEKRLRLKEEIHITRDTRVTISKETVCLKSEQIQIERFDERSIPPKPAPGGT